MMAISHGHGKATPRTDRGERDDRQAISFAIEVNRLLGATAVPYRPIDGIRCDKSRVECRPRIERGGERNPLRCLSGGDRPPSFAVWDDARALVALAVERFGDLHILVNNAGFCRDRMIFNMTEDEFDSVIRVHLKGHFCTMRFASEHWRTRAKEIGRPVYARLINTSSEAFIFGSPGQPNYAAAKAGTVAMTMSAAQTLERYGVTANAIMPRARTRMNDSGTLAEMFAKPAEGFDLYAPENVSPLVAYLASPAAARVSGYVLIVYGKQITLVAAPQLEPVFDTAAPWTVDGVAATLGPWFATHRPVLDGFTVMPA